MFDLMLFYKYQHEHICWKSPAQSGWHGSKMEALQRIEIMPET